MARKGTFAKQEIDRVFGAKALPESEYEQQLFEFSMEQSRKAKQLRPVQKQAMRLSFQVFTVFGDLRADRRAKPFSDATATQLHDILNECFGQDPSPTQLRRAIRAAVKLRAMPPARH